MSILMTIYFAGGCFWGVEEFFSRLPGVTSAVSGYAQSDIPNPTYEQVCSGRTGAAETVEVEYNQEIIDLPTLVQAYFSIIDPFSINRQGNDVGTQYRTGIFYVNSGEESQLKQLFSMYEKEFGQPLAVELAPLKNFYPAEDYHQDYLKKNPAGYCHINLNASHVQPVFRKPADEELRKRLSPIAYNVIAENGTERPFSGEYWNKFEKGIYVDISTGEPLFLSTDKFESGCGWPAFSRPITPDAITERMDSSHGMLRTEARSKYGDSHLGHIFDDGPADKGGLRYCINSVALRFVPYQEMEQAGYGYLKPVLDRK